MRSCSVRFASVSKQRSRRSYVRVSAAVAAAYGYVPHGQWALLDAEILVLIDGSARLVGPCSRACASRITLDRRRVRSPLASVRREALLKVIVLLRTARSERLCCSCRLTATAPATFSFGVLVSSSPTVSCTLSSWHLLVFRSWSSRALWRASMSRSW